MNSFVKKMSAVSLLMLTLLLVISGCGKNDVEPAEIQSENEISLSSISGTWRENSEAGVKVLMIDSDGGYLLLYEVGATERGSVKIETENNQNQSKSEPRFVFYSETGDLWAESTGNADYSSELLLESGGKDMRFERIDENQKTSANDYLGMWQCGRCSITISEKGDAYQVNIVWGSSAVEQAEWEYICRYDNETETLICDGGATSADVVYNEKGKKKIDYYYKDGSGSFWARGDVLLWNDNKEGRGNDLIFVHIPVEK